MEPFFGRGGISTLIWSWSRGYSRCWISPSPCVGFLRVLQFHLEVPGYAEVCEWVNVCVLRPRPRLNTYWRTLNYVMMPKISSEEPTEYKQHNGKLQHLKSVRHSWMLSSPDCIVIYIITYYTIAFCLAQWGAVGARFHGNNTFPSRTSCIYHNSNITR